MSLGIQNDVDKLMARLKEAGVSDLDVLELRTRIDVMLERAAMKSTSPETPRSRGSSQKMPAVRIDEPQKSSSSSQQIRAIPLHELGDDDDDDPKN